MRDGDGSSLASPSALMLRPAFALVLPVLALGCAPLPDDDATAPIAEDFEDSADDDKADGVGRLGAGVNALDGDGRPRAIFKKSAAGVVGAAMYELHRGERRTLDQIYADATISRVTRGPYAAIEGLADDDTVEGTNWDLPTAPSIAQVKVGGTWRNLRAIETYLRVNGIYGAAPWCGSFASYLYARAGVVLPTMKLARNAQNVIAAAGGTYYQLAADEVLLDPEHPDDSRVSYTGPLELGRAGTQASYRASSARSLADVDLRPGDVMWLIHADNSGHLAIVVGVSRTSEAIRVVTIEGNKDDRVGAHVRTMRREGDDFVAEWKGWGRPALLEGAPVAFDADAPPAWVQAAIAGLDDATGGDR